MPEAVFCRIATGSVYQPAIFVNILKDQIIGSGKAVNSEIK